MRRLADTASSLSILNAEFGPHALAEGSSPREKARGKIFDWRAATFRRTGRSFREMFSEDLLDRLRAI